MHCVSALTEAGLGHALADDPSQICSMHEGAPCGRYREEELEGRYFDALLAMRTLMTEMKIIGRDRLDEFARRVREALISKRARSARTPSPEMRRLLPNQR